MADNKDLKDIIIELIAVAIGVPTGLAIIYGKELRRVSERELRDKLALMNFDTVVSYTTRPKRPYETDGIEHYFISDEQADEMLNNENNIAAYTKIGEFRYFATWEEVKKKNIYVIDPKGVSAIIDNAIKSDNVPKKIVMLYIDTNKHTRYKRAKGRKGFDKIVYKAREISEDYQFGYFEDHMKEEYENKLADKIDASIYKINNNFSEAKTMAQVYTVLVNTYSRDTLYLVIGRTCSGKDTICRNIIETVKRYKAQKEDK